MALSFKRTLTGQKRVKIPEWYWNIYDFSPGDEVVIEIKKVSNHPPVETVNGNEQSGSVTAHE